MNIKHHICLFVCTNVYSISPSPEVILFILFIHSLISHLFLCNSCCCVCCRRVVRFRNKRLLGRRSRVNLLLSKEVIGLEQATLSRWIGLRLAVEAAGRTVIIVRLVVRVVVEGDVLMMWRRIEV